jgi:hypothetical protein
VDSSGVPGLADYVAMVREIYAGPITVAGNLERIGLLASALKQVPESRSRKLMLIVPRS